MTRKKSEVSLEARLLQRMDRMDRLAQERRRLQVRNEKLRTALERRRRTEPDVDGDADPEGLEADKE